jgi:hypothetical protein
VHVLIGHQVEVHLGSVDGDLSLVDGGERQQVLNDVPQPLHLPLHRLQVLWSSLLWARLHQGMIQLEVGERRA